VAAGARTIRPGAVSIRRRKLSRLIREEAVTDRRRRGFPTVWFGMMDRLEQDGRPTSLPSSGGAGWRLDPATEAP
jgi:hypothetical protein